jgi:hypothetical protein
LAAANLNGISLDQYEKPETHYSEMNKSWAVFFEGKEKAPGNQFLVIVNDETGETEIVRGK